MSELYNHKVVEKKWQKVWDDNKAFAATDDYSKPKYYALVEFPYPSGQGLHRLIFGNASADICILSEALRN